MQHKIQINFGCKEHRMICRWGNVNVPQPHAGGDFERMNPRMGREEFEKKRKELHNRKDNVLSRIGKIQQRVQNKGQWEQYKQQFLRDFEYWNTQYDRIATGHRRAFQRNLASILRRYEYQIAGRETQKGKRGSQQEKVKGETGKLERLHGNTWAIETPHGSRLGLKFDTYENWQYMQPNTASMGEMRMNGFRVSRDPRNRNRIIIQSNLPFEYSVSGGRRDSTSKQPDTTVQRSQQLQKQPKQKRTPKTTPPSPRSTPFRQRRPDVRQQNIERQKLVEQRKFEQAKGVPNEWVTVPDGIRGYEYYFNSATDTLYARSHRSAYGRKYYRLNSNWHWSDVSSSRLPQSALDSRSSAGSKQREGRVRPPRKDVEVKPKVEKPIEPSQKEPTHPFQRRYPPRVWPPKQPQTAPTTPRQSSKPQGLPDQLSRRTTNEQNHDEAVQKAERKQAAERRKQEKEQSLKDAKSLIERYDEDVLPLIKEAKQLEDCYTYDVESAYEGLQTAVNGEGYGVYKVENYLPRLTKAIAELKDNISKAKEARSNILEKKRETLRTARTFLNSLDKTKSKYSHQELSKIVAELNEMELTRWNRKAMEKKFDEVEGKIAQINGRLDAAKERVKGREYLKKVKAEFDDLYEEERRVKRLEIDEGVFKKFRDAYYALSSATGEYSHASTAKVLTCVSVLKSTAETYREAVAEKKASPTVKDLKVVPWHAQSIEKYDLRYIPEGKVVDLYRNGRYFRSGDRLFYAGGTTHGAGKILPHHVYNDVEDRDKKFILTKGGEFLPIEQESHTRDISRLNIYRANGDRYFNEFGVEYKEHPNGLYKLEDKEEYIGVVPDGRWQKFTVNDDGIGWGTWKEDKDWGWSDKLPITSGNHTRVVLPNKDKINITGEFITGANKWEYNPEDKRKIEAEAKKIQELYPLLDEARSLLYDRVNVTRSIPLITVYKDADKLKKVEALLPGVRQAHDLIEGIGGKKGDGTLGNPSMQKYVSIFKDYEEAYTIMKKLRSNPTFASYDKFERQYCETCFKAGKREEGIKAVRAYLKEHPPSEDRNDEHWKTHWAIKLLAKHLGTDPRATQAERKEAITLAGEFNPFDPEEYSNILADTYAKDGQYEKGVRVMLLNISTISDETEPIRKKIESLPQKLQLFLLRYNLVESFEDGVIKGDVDIETDAFEKFPEGITKIEGDLDIKSTNFTGLSQDLKEVGGNCTLDHSSALHSLANAGLEKVGGIFLVNNCTNLQELPRKLQSVRHLMAGLCINLQKLPPNLNVKVGAYLGSCSRIAKIPPGFKAGYLEIPDAVKKRSK